ncbi:hypothetical protein PsYK624_159270 [Phanerochaete sordida]|uniref:Uncharacterized protein n=1 Tax=Phanerochaete sordida TaxID=48140 RepID=A0A9P3LLM0_9APHY|nr:hypothetical protein PsYK624_159270 [Phanerochaete sordida]
MYPTAHYQPRVAPGLRASLRVSTKFLSFPARHLHQQNSDDTSEGSDDAAERLSFCDDDLVDIDPEERSAAAAAFSSPMSPRSPVSPFETHILPLILRPHISLAIVKNLAPHSTPVDSPIDNYLQQSSDTETDTAIDDYIPPVIEEPTPDPGGPTPAERILLDYRRTSGSSVHALSIDQVTDTLFDSDPFRKEEAVEEKVFRPKLVPISPLRVIQDELADPNHIPPSPPTSRPASTSTITPSHAISSIGLNPFRRSIKRLRTLTRSKSILPARRASSEPRKPVSAGHTGPTPRPHVLPELAFDHTPFLLDVTKFERAPNSAAPDLLSERHEAAAPAPRSQPAARTSPEDSRPSFALIKWERVDPKTLTPSPYAPTATDISPAETPLLVPSTPSWLSRNTIGIDPHRRFLHPPSPLIEVTPPSPESPAPLPILPRSLLPVPSHPASPRIEVLPPDDSSVTLYSPSVQRPRPRLTIPGPHTPLLSKLTPTALRQTFSDNRASIRSFLTAASIAFGDQKDSPLVASVAQDSPTQARFFLLLHPPSRDPSPVDPQPSPLPLPLKLAFRNSLLIDSCPCTPIERPAAQYEVFRPDARADEESKDTFPLPNYLRVLIKNSSRLSRALPEMDVYAKQADTVDWGDEVDYSGYEWFKDPPPRPEPAPPPPATEPYVPQPGVIEQNDMFDYALKSAPNVLYQRYKQYGQLGVLAWCSEFSEMIDALKALGFEGNMFVSTRTQALKTCEDVLALNLDIEMQIIVMYLSSQVARLRRFLDSERTWEDYPQPKFPVHPDIELSRT